MSQIRDSKSFTEGQIQQYEQLGSQVQRANALAAESLLTLCRCQPGHKQCEDVYRSLAKIVLRMNLLIGCCEQIFTSGSMTKYTHINVTFGTTCGYCEEMARRAKRSNGASPGRTLDADPAWCVQVEHLLQLATLTIDRAVASEYSRDECEEHLRCLTNLVKVLIRQDRHLKRMGRVRVPEIAVIYDDAEACSECGNPYTSGPPQDEDDANSPTTL